MTEDQPDPQQAEQAAFLLRLSARPAILAGGGALQAEASRELSALAERVDAPVVTTWGGKSVLADSHPMVAGALFGQPEADTMLEGADAVLGVGINFDDQPGEDLDLPAQLVQIDLDPDRLGNRYPLRLGIAGDAKVVLGQILQALEKPSPLQGAPGDRTEVPEAERTGANRAKKVRGQVLDRLRHEASAQAVALESIRQAIRPDALIVGMPGTSLPWTAPFLEIRQPETWATSDDPEALFELARQRSASGPVVVLCDGPDLKSNLARLQGCKALTILSFLHGGEKPTKLMQSCLDQGFSTILVDTPTEIAAALTVMMPSGSPSAILATFRWDRS